MSRFLRALEKVGLVEVERQRAAEAAEASLPSDAASAPAMPEPMPRTDDALAHSVPIEGSAIREQRPLDEIYAEAQVAGSPFSAEKLLRILDGLAALEPSARTAAVRALDAADDSWSIDDALLDAERKVRALDTARKQLEDQARAALEQARGAIDAREQRQQDAVARIRQQIAELEALLEREVTRATEEKAALHDAARAAKQACAREAARYEAEIARLRRLAEIFAPPPAGAAPQR